MKTLKIIPFILAVVAITVSSALATDEKYVEAMQKNIEAINKAQGVDEIQNAVNMFERIAAAEKTKWEPYYYSSYGYIVMATRESDVAKKDNYLDLALKGIESAKVIQPNESEIIALEGFAHMIRISIDPQTRGQIYSGLALQSFNKAVSINPENPRALTLMARMQYGMAQFFGSPTTEACGTLNKSLEKFETYKSDNPLAPQWGKKMAEGLMSKCN